MHDNRRGNNRRNRQADNQKQHPKDKRLEDMKGRTVMVISKTGHWYVGWLKGISNRGIIITGVVRLEPEFEGDKPVVDETVHATVRRSYPFIVPISNSDNLYIRKLFIPWSNIQLIGRAKLESELIKESQQQEEGSSE